MKYKVKSLILNALKQIFAETEEVEHSGGLSMDTTFASLNFDIYYPKAEFGHYATNAAMVAFGKIDLAKKFQNPANFAKILAEKIADLDDSNYFDSVASAGGFINFKLSQKSLTQNAVRIFQEQKNFGVSNLMAKQGKILLEYFQPNIAKPLHLGHLENGVFGDSVFKLLKACGANVESDTHLGDWGTQFGQLLLAYKKWGDMHAIEQNPIAELNKLYIRINAEIEYEPELQKLSKQEFVKLEKGDPENIQLWQKFKDFSWQEFNFMYQVVGIRKSDHDWPESFFSDKIPQILEQLKSKNLLQESQGAQIVNLEEYNLGIALLVKSDGGTTYLLRDLATYIFRKSQGFKKQIYVVDDRQGHTLAQTFKILELLGQISDAKGEAIHLAYGFMKLPSGAMSTRKGKIASAKEVVDEAIIEARKIIEQKNPNLANKEEAAKSVGIASVKYFIVSRNLRGDIIYEPSKAIAFEGNTGPYLQYTYARINGIFRKAGINIKDFMSTAHQFMQEAQSLSEFEYNVLAKLVYFPEVVQRSAEDFSPSILASYLFELGQTFNNFYQQEQILSQADSAKKNVKLAIASSTAQVLENGLGLLGIDALKEM